jgi:integrase
MQDRDARHVLASVLGVQVEQRKDLFVRSDCKEKDSPAEDQLTVNRTTWHGIEGVPKTKARKNAVPLLSIVREELAAHQKANPGTTWVFEGPKARPYDLATLGNKIIKIALAGNATKWQGRHALRRGFATRLHEAGVQGKMIQSLMRHSSLSVTMKHYVKVLPAATVEAMQALVSKK